VRKQNIREKSMAIGSVLRSNENKSPVRQISFRANKPITIGACEQPHLFFRVESVHVA